VRALTGTDPDRLKEEKERGITIDLGFAHVDLAPDVVASFVDVPGHERFVRNMLAGAHGIDAALLVVAADESVMPQTREHFHICRLLGIPRGLVALTKCDLADADTRSVAETEARELVAGSFLDGRPVVCVSARTGEGLDELRTALLALARQAPARSTAGLLRLPIDRVFSLKGFGTVVTGTLSGGELADGEEVEVLPSGRRVRVRGLQVHGAAVALVPAGTRTAANLAGVDVEELARGDVLVRPGTLRATSMLDVEITLLAGARALRQGARLRVHAASAELLARVRMLEGDTIEPGASGLAQLRLESMAAAGRGDRLVLRSYSPAETIGGAVVLDPLPPRRRPASRVTVARLRAASGDLRATAVALVEEAGAAGIEIPLLAARLGVARPALLEALGGESAIVLVGSEPAIAVAAGALEQRRDGASAALAAFHAREPLQAGMPREELRTRVFSDAAPAAFDRVLADLVSAGHVRLVADGVALASHEVTLTGGEAEVRQALVDAALEAGLAGVEARALAERRGKEARLVERIGRVLVTEKVLDRVGDGLLVHREHLESLKRNVRRRFPPGTPLEVKAFKEMTGLTRKHVIPLLEYLDRERVTRRAGGDRVVL
jgi:selenocysteine-specific elongation factor